MKYENEIWKLIPNTTNVRVSNYGRIKRSRRIAKLTKDREGYMRVTILGKSYRVHRLVAEAFVENPNPEEYTDVDHINNEHDCNVWTNLRWCTHQQNTKWAAEAGLMSTGNCTPVIAINSDNQGFIYNSRVECANAIGAQPKAVSKCCNNKLKSVKGYRIFSVNKINDTRFNIDFEETGCKYGSTSCNGNWIEMRKGNYTVKLVDDNSEPESIKSLMDKCNNILENFTED